MAGGAGSTRRSGVRELHVRPRALADIAEIRRYTRKTCGPVQARTYLNELGARFEAIADGTARSVVVHAKNRPFGRCRYTEHFIFFQELPDAVEIVRVLHPRRDIAAQLSES
ncbi:MAG: type II toxin-antitoxin system RelE/ParE family toxin [Allosphingosinicella sp.]